MKRTKPRRSNIGNDLPPVDDEALLKAIEALATQADDLARTIALRFARTGDFPDETPDALRQLGALGMVSLAEPHALEYLARYYGHLRHHMREVSQPSGEP